MSDKVDGRVDGENRKTQAWLDVICLELREGGSFRSAAAKCSRTDTWLHLWRKADPAVDEACKRAIAEWEGEAAKRIARDADWKAPAWLLARRFPDEYGNKVALDVTVYEASKAKQEAQRLLGLTTPGDADDAGDDDD